MIFDGKSEVFLGIDCSRVEAFSGFNNHQVWIIIYKSDGPALMRKVIVADGEKLELRSQGLAKFSIVLFEYKQNLPITRFPFGPDVYFRIGKMH